VSRRKRKHNANGDVSNKRQRMDEDDDIMPLINKEDLDDLLSKLREDIQEDTSECVNHVHRLLQRFKDEWHEKSHRDSEQSHVLHTSPVTALQSPTAPPSAHRFPSRVSIATTKMPRFQILSAENRNSYPTKSSGSSTADVSSRAHTTSAKRHGGSHQRDSTTANGRIVRTFRTGSYMSRA
jgi:hypothetical protein